MLFTHELDSIVSKNIFIYSVNFVYFSGNKIDREDREIPTEVGEHFAKQHGMYYLETSAKASDNVEKLFMQIAAELMEVSVELYLYIL